MNKDLQTTLELFYYLTVIAAVLSLMVWAAVISPVLHTGTVGRENRLHGTAARATETRAHGPQGLHRQEDTRDQG